MYKKPEVSAQAKILSAQVKAQFGLHVPHQAALELVAKMYGYTSWNACAADTQVSVTRPEKGVHALALSHVMNLVFSELGPWKGKEVALLDALRSAAFESDWSEADRKARALFDLRELVQSEDYALALPLLVPCIERQVRATEALLRQTGAGSHHEPEVLANDTVYDWRFQDDGDQDSQSPDPEDRQPYMLRITRDGDQFYVDIAVPHTKPDETEGTAGLSLFIEINDGKPCVHLTNDMYGDQLLSVYGVEEGVVVRTNNAEFDRVDDHSFAQSVGGQWLVTSSH